ncbi:hypothetical protein QBC32DRAFT_385095, partial [Pseudoneurospora amorphoporcata]
ANYVPDASTGRQTCDSYIDLYEKQWGTLFGNTDSGLLDYDNRSVMTTWTISFDKIKVRDKNAGNLLRLWAFLDNREMWHGLLQVARNNQEQWISHIQNDAKKRVFLRLTAMLIRFSVPDREYNIEDITISHATHNLGLLYSNQGRLKEAEAMYQRALEGYEKALGPDHTSTLGTVNNLGNLYSAQGRLKEADAMYLDVQVIETSKAKLGANHPNTLTSIANLAFTWNSQGRHEDAQR